MLRVTYDKDGRPVASKEMNPTTGKESTKDVEFSITNYGTKTAGAATSARGLSVESLDIIVRLALESSQAVASSTPGPIPKSGDEDFSLLFEV